MVKPVFNAREKMNEARTADEAFIIGINFLGSADALKVESGDAGTFAKDVVRIFVEKDGTDLLIQLVNLAAKKAEQYKLSHNFAASLQTELTDYLDRAKYQQEAPAALYANAVALGGAINAMNALSVKKSFDDQASLGRYPDIAAANNTKDLAAAVNAIMMEREILDAEAQEFLEAVKSAFADIKSPEISTEDRIEILDMIVNASSEKDMLYHLALDEAIKTIKSTQVASLDSANDYVCRPA